MRSCFRATASVSRRAWLILMKTVVNFINSNIPATKQIRPKTEKPSNNLSAPNIVKTKPTNMRTLLLIIIIRLKNFRCARASSFDLLRELIMSRLILWSSTSRFKSARRSGEGAACFILSFSLTGRTSQA